jgi:hypothetical protein
MNRQFPLFGALCAAALVALPSAVVIAQQVPRMEQEGLRDQFKRGNIQSLRQIESNVVPAMRRRGAAYIGAEFEPTLLRYRLKFMRQSSVIWIDVDGRTGEILAQAGN